jgi:hypothetical protein
MLAPFIFQGVFAAPEENKRNDGDFFDKCIRNKIKR